MKKLMVVLLVGIVLLLSGCSEEALVAELKPVGVETILVENIITENVITEEITFEDSTVYWDD